MVLYNHRKEHTNTDRKDNTMMYYMTAICEFDDVVRIVSIYGIQNRKQLIERIAAEYPEQNFKLLGYECRRSAE